MTYGKLGSICDADFAEIVKNSFSIADVAECCGYRRKSGSMSIQIKKRILDMGLDTQHFKPYSHPAYNRISLDDILNNRVEYSNSGRLKDRLITEGLLEYRCALCGNEGEWNGKSLILQLDHINGDHFDNRLSNLRILCPNCHTQTDTFGAKRSKGTLKCGQVSKAELNKRIYALKKTNKEVEKEVKALSEKKRNKTKKRIRK